MISAVVLTKNEEENIEKCLRTLRFCNEIVVIDDNSNDHTRDIAKKLGAEIYKRDMDMDYAAQSNYGMEKAKNKWVLFVDADERISNELADEITEAVGYEGVSGFLLRRIDYMWGKWLTHGEVGSNRFMRLVRKRSGKWVRRVHPRFEIRGKTLNLKNPILHYPHPSVKEFIAKVDKWSTWHALANSEEGKKATISKVVLMPIGHFIRNFILNLGFLDGIRGLIFAFVMSFHSYLAWSKLLLLQRVGAVSFRQRRIQNEAETEF